MRRWTPGTSPFSCAPRKAARERLGRRPPADPIPRWVRLLHRALSGAVTVDNLDYVRRDARMCGVGARPHRRRPAHLLHLLHRRGPHVPQARAELAAGLPQRALLHVRERVLPPHRARHRPAPARDLPAHAWTSSCRPARSRTRAPTGGSREWSLFTTVEAWLDEPLHSLRRELAEEWQSIIHRHVKYSVVYEHHVERQQPLPAGARPDARGVPRGHRGAPAARAPRRGVRRRHRLPGPAAAQPVRRAQAAARLRPRHRSHRGAAPAAASSSSCPPRRICTGCSRSAASTSVSSLSRLRRR